MNKLLQILALSLLLMGSTSVMAQAKPKSGKKVASPFIEGRQKVRQDDFDTVWKFTNFSTKDTKVYFMPYDYANFANFGKQKNPDWGSFTPVVSYLQKSTRAVATICAIYAINPDIEDAALRESLSQQARTTALDALQGFEAWRVKKEMRNKLTYQVAEIDYKYFKGTAYYDEQVVDDVIRVGLLMYFGTKKKPIFTVDTDVRTFEDIKFFPNDATIVESWLPAIDTLASYLKENERKSVMLIGYCDNQGTAAYLTGLSRQRATEVKKALLMRGVDKDRIEIEARGDADPIGDNSTREGRIQNNRVAIKIL